jgi:Rrf2 family protein
MSRRGVDGSARDAAGRSRPPRAAANISGWGRVGAALGRIWRAFFHCACSTTAHRVSSLLLAMLTMKTKYALKALALLATVDQATPMLIADIAEREGIPKKFLELILRELKQHGILDSRKGRGGGYLLRRRPEDINLASIIRILDGPLAPVPCLSQTAYRRCEGCEDERTCGIRLVLKEMHQSTLRVLEGTTLADVAAKVKEAAAGVGAKPVARYSI